jgi:ammonium transporter, Amt family
VSWDTWDTVASLLGVLRWSHGYRPGDRHGIHHLDDDELVVQTLAVLVAWVWAAAATWVILKGLDVTIGLRVSPEHELAGLDASIHGEPAYENP